MTQDWYSPSEIKFSRHQVIWIIEHLESLSAGIYPPEHKITGYTGKRKGGYPSRAYFETPCQLSAEVSRRLKATKTDGKLLKAQIQSGVTDYELLEPEAQMALNYISLWDFRKRSPYYIFKKNSLYCRDKRRLKLRPYSLNQNKRGN